MENSKALVVSIRAVDKAFKKRLASDTFTSLAELKLAGETEYTSVIKRLTSQAIEASPSAIDEIETAINKAFGGKYLSPLFSKILETYTHEDFPYDFDKKQFSSFISSLKKQTTATGVENFLHDYVNRVGKDDAFDNFLTREFKPRCPSYYVVNTEKSKIKNSFKINAETVVENIATVLNMPQIHSKKDLLFSMAMALGMDLKSVLAIKEMKVLSSHSVSLKLELNQDNETTAVTQEDVKTLCDAATFLRSWLYLQENPIKESYALTRKDDSAETILNISGFMKRSIPVLYRLLLKHFHLIEDDKSKASVSSFEITGSDNIDAIIKKHAENQRGKVDAALDNLPSQDAELLKKTLAYIEENVGAKITVRDLRAAMKCKANDAIALCATLDSLFILGGKTHG